MTFTEWLIRQPDTAFITLEAAWNAGFAAGVADLLRKQNEALEAEPKWEQAAGQAAPSQEVMLQYPAAGCVIGEPQIAAPSQEPVDWKAEYLQCVDGHNLTLDELRDAAAQIAEYKRNWLEAVESVMRQNEQIAKLEAENAELRQALVHYDFWTDVPQQAVNAIDAVLSGAPPSELSDERILEIAHRKAWRYKHSSDPHHSDTYTFNRMCMIEFARAVLKEGE